MQILILRLRYLWCRFIKLAKLKPKFRSLKTEENEIKTHKIVAMVFLFVFLCLFWRFKARESDVFKITVGLARLSKSDRYFENVAFASLKSPKYTQKHKSKHHGSNFMSFYFIFLSF